MRMCIMHCAAHESAQLPVTVRTCSELRRQQHQLSFNFLYAACHCVASAMAAQVYAKRLTPEVKARINSAQGLSLDWNRSCSSSLIRTIEDHADAVGAPKEYIFFPLLTVVASFMGVNTRMCVNPEWSEPAILWSVVAARKGEKKTAALKRLLNIVEVSLIVPSY